MFIGHYAASFGAKIVERRVPLWVYVAAAQLLDIVWCVLVMLGIERVEAKPSATEGLAFTFYPYSHSLTAALAWSAVGWAFVRWIVKGGRRGAVLAGLVVFSHWLLDALVHHPDLPLWPGDRPRIGFALWDHPLAESGLEMGAFAVLGLVWGAVRKTDGRAFWPAAVFVGAGLLVMLGSLASKPEGAVDPMSLGAMGLAVYLGMTFVAWLVDRPARGPDAPPVREALRS